MSLLLSQENVSNILNKEERHIYNGEIRTTPSPYRLYINEMFTDELENADNCKTVFAEIRHAWKVLKPKKKKIYTAAAAIVSLAFFSFLIEFKFKKFHFIFEE